MSIITARRPTRRLEQCPDGVWVVETDGCPEGPQPYPVELRVLARQLAEVLHSLRRCQTAKLSTGERRDKTRSAFRENGLGLGV